MESSLVDQYQKEKEEQRQQGIWKTFQVKMTIKPEQVVTSRVDPYQLYPQEQVPNSPVLGQRILNIRQGDCSYGEKGTVIGIDDTGSLMMRWDNGSGLNVLYGIDRCRIITE